MANKIVLFNNHIELDAKMVDFYGWNMAEVSMCKQCVSVKVIAQSFVHKGKKIF